MTGLHGRSIVVTGGGSGIGRAAVELLCAAGARVTFGDVNEVGAQATLAAAEPDAALQYVRTDVTDEPQVKALVDAAVARYGRLDGALNAAGIVQHWKRVHELSTAEWDRVNAVNLRGMYFCFKYQLQAMLANGGGSIVAVASIAATMAFGCSPEYCASKAGVTGLVRGTAFDYARDGIRVNALLPGATDTPLVYAALASKPKDLGSYTLPMNRMAQPAEVARAALFLLSDESSYMTGHSLVVDGLLSVA